MAQNEKFNQLAQILYPENLDSSKAYSIFNEKLECKLIDFLTLPEIGKIDKSEQIIKDFLNQIPFLTIENDTISYKLHPELNIFSLINLPFNFTKEKVVELIKFLTEHQKEIIRFYKKSLFWIIVLESNSLSDSFESQLKNLKFSETNKEGSTLVNIKFERQSSEKVKSELIKLVTHHTYGNLKKEGDYKSMNSGQKMSWRKKSNDTNEQQFFKGKDSVNFSRGGNIQSNIRDRYHSDGTKPAFKPNKKFDEIEIDLSKINYSLKIKHKYSNADLLLYYDKFRINKIFETIPKFENFIEEICSKQKRKEFTFLKRERSLTFSNKIDSKVNQDEIKLNLDAPVFKLPDKNPLSGKLTGIKINK